MLLKDSFSTACLLMNTMSSKHLTFSQVWFLCPTEHLPDPHTFLPPLVVTHLSRFQETECTSLIDHLCQSEVSDKNGTLRYGNGTFG